MRHAIDQQIPADNTAGMMLPESPHTLPAAELLGRLRVSSAYGLSDDEVKKRRKRFGANTITSRRAASAMRLLLHQFKSPVVYLLGGAAGLAFYFGELEEGSGERARAPHVDVDFTRDLEASPPEEWHREMAIASSATCFN
jgi:magnesium-transporting ATPase (P-type)